MSNPRKWLQCFDVFPSRANGFASGTSTDTSICRNPYPKLDMLSTKFGKLGIPLTWLKLYRNLSFGWADSKDLSKTQTADRDRNQTGEESSMDMEISCPKLYFGIPY